MYLKVNLHKSIHSPLWGTVNAPLRLLMPEYALLMQSDQVVMWVSRSRMPFTNHRGTHPSHRDRL